MQLAEIRLPKGISSNVGGARLLGASSLGRSGVCGGFTLAAGHGQ